MSNNMLDILKNFDAADSSKTASRADKSDMRTILESFNAVSEAPMPVPMDASPSMPPSMPPQNPGQPVSMNVSLNASGKDHVQDLISIMKLAGVEGGVPGDSKLDLDIDGDNQPDLALMPKEAEEDVDEGSIKFMHDLANKGHSHEEIADKLKMSPDEVKDAMSKTEEEYANEPKEKYGALDDVIPSGDDLHKKKTGFSATAGGDNPMAVESIKDRLWAALNEKKMPMGPGPDGKEGTKDDKPAFLDQKTGDKKKTDSKGLSPEQKKYFSKKK